MVLSTGLQARGWILNPIIALSDSVLSMLGCLTLVLRLLALITKPSLVACRDPQFQGPSAAPAATTVKLQDLLVVSACSYYFRTVGLKQQKSCVSRCSAHLQTRYGPLLPRRVHPRLLSPPVMHSFMKDPKAWLSTSTMALS